METDKRANHLAFAALIAVQVCFGTFPVAGKVVLAVIPSVALVGFRVGIAAVILFTFQYFRGSLRLARKSDYWILAGFGIIGITLNQLFFVKGLSLTKATNASLVSVTIPMFTVLAGAIFGTERLTGRKVAGILLSALGVVFLIDPRNASFSDQTTIGDLLVVLNSLCYGVYVATSKDVVTRNGAMLSITWIFLFAALICVPAGLHSLSTVDAAAIEPLIWLLVVHIAVAATAVPYFLNAWALAKVDPSIVAVFVYLQPVIGFLTAVALLGEAIGLNFLAAAALIFAGVSFVTLRPRPD
ncbi:MAG: DMT family transporter [Pyrinomonadaceae bacterium]